jgi:hypothetical protein
LYTIALTYSYSKDKSCNLGTKRWGQPAAYLNGSVGQKDADVQLNILLLEDRRPPNPTYYIKTKYKYKYTPKN